jgi:prepilin-type N-terminal cleavage/methylation domain-containing protein
MKRAFTLLEILVSVTIVALISGGALVYLNKFNSQQFLNKSKDEVVSAMKLAQSYAKTRQLPFGFGETELNFVQVKISENGFLELRANSDIGPTYSSLLVNSGAISVGSTPAIIYFWAGDGRLSRDTFGTSYGSDEKATLYVRAGGDVNDYVKIEIDAMGQIVN